MGANFLGKQMQALEKNPGFFLLHEAGRYLAEKIHERKGSSRRDLAKF